MTVLAFTTGLRPSWLRPLRRSGLNDEAEGLRRRSHVEHLVESAKLAVRAAGDTSSRQIEERVRTRQGREGASE